MSELTLAQQLARKQVAELTKRADAEAESIVSGGASDWTDYKRRVERRKVLMESRQLAMDELKKVIESDDE